MKLSATQLQFLRQEAQLALALDTKIVGIHPAKIIALVDRDNERILDLEDQLEDLQSDSTEMEDLRWELEEAEGEVSELQRKLREARVEIVRLELELEAVHYPKE